MIIYVKKLVIFLLVIALLALIGCVRHTEPYWEYLEIDENAMIRLYFADPNTMEFDYMYINQSELIEKMMEVNGIPIDDVRLTVVCATYVHRVVDLNAEAELTSLQGSTGAQITTEVLIRTFASFPQIDSILIAIDGIFNRYGDHFDYRGRWFVNETGEIDWSPDDNWRE